jgi:hypothetical protein
MERGRVLREASAGANNLDGHALPAGVRVALAALHRQREHHCVPLPEKVEGVGFESREL